MTRPTKILKLFTFLLLISSCSNKEQIAEFENVLGKENSGTLTSMVSEFENDFLKTKYPNISTEKAYSEYLTELESNIAGNWERPSKKNIDKFNKSELKKVVYGLPDSIWVEESRNKNRTEYRIRRKYLNTKGGYEIGTLEASIPKVTDEDSLVATLKNYYDINYFGKYREALKTVSKEDKFVKKYLQMTKEAGMLDPRMIAYEMLIADLDFDDYFIKRLIVTEIVYRL
ncbi:hypothetical protein DFQ05_0998 [Winogradskyella wandonensis]|uniref:Uncharacterized protein n=1 Tax=Winogradskyella wandonensis TaxID=1442586 RepID=A0A4R1KQ83_9FLAO|nr:hypothetical protein [Winogradskyella wandonensis]TCK67225.1 hypothetical protein DFQ05_0998 [Winogradskyella wandonensis]